jgi:hypothetical protein
VVADNLAHSGYVIFATYAGAYVGVIQASYDLTATSTAVGLAATDPGSRLGRASMGLGDALVDRVGARYLALATATYTTGNDVVVLSLDGTAAPVATDGWRFGTPALDEGGYRIVQPAEGGFLLTGQGSTASGGPLRYWVTRTDERFNVPFNGTAPGLQSSSPLAYAPAADLKLAGGLVTCPATWVDLTRPTAASVSAPGAPFTPVVTIQAP